MPAPASDLFFLIDSTFCSQTACSVGYWQNHTEVWFGLCCDVSSGECNDLLSDLNARGKRGRGLRDAARDLLNICFEVSPCLEIE